jgi:hypothetical protein
VPGALPLRVTASIQRPFCDPRSLRLLPYLRPTSDAKFPLSYPVAATAVSSIANPRRPPAVNHDPLRSLDVLSARGERAHPRVLQSFSGLRIFYPRHRSSSTGVSPPTSHQQHCAHRFAWSPLLVPCSGFNDLNILNLLLLLGFYIFYSVPSTSLFFSWVLQ